MQTHKSERVDYARLTDEDLVAHVRQGVGAALRVLMQRYNRRLYRVARSVVQDETEAEDVVQETYARAYAALAGFRGDSRFSTWLTRIALNEALGRVRRRRPMETLHALDSAVKEGDHHVIMLPGLSTDPELAAARAEVRRLLERAIDDLPDPLRLVFVMRDVEEMSIEETAAALAIRAETVKTRLHRARRLLRRELHSQLSTALEDAFPFAGTRCERLTAAVLGRLE